MEHRTRSPGGQFDGLGWFDDGGVLETNIVGRPARENALYRAAARAEQFPQFVEVQGLGDIVEKKKPKASA